jgi:hypothetical protein
MKKLLTLLTAITLMLSLTACGGDDTSSTKTSSKNNSSSSQDKGNSDSTPAGNDSDSGNDNAGGGTADWESTFAEISGIPFMITPPESEVEYNKDTPSKVTFKVKSEITDDMFTSYAALVFNACRAASPDRIYEYDGTGKGNEIAGFSEVYSGGALMCNWYYTNNGFISQMSLEADGNTITAKINDVYNRDGQIATP